MNAHLHVITGGPGAGKASVAAALVAKGFRLMPEGGRAIVQDRTAIGGNALPWGDRAALAALMRTWELRPWHDAADTTAPVVFDRAIPDIVGYLRLCRLPVPDMLLRAAAARRHGGLIFVAPHWPDIERILISPGHSRRS